MDFLKTVTGKIVGGFVGLAVLLAAVSWWQMSPATRDALLSGTGRIFAWLGIVLVVPWASFFVVGWVGHLSDRAGHNGPGYAIIFVYTLGEALLLAKLFHWSLPGATSWTFFAVGTLVAGAYNLFTCDWIAEKME